MDTSSIELRQRAPHNYLAREQAPSSVQALPLLSQSEPTNTTKPLGELQRSYQILNKVHLNLSMTLLVLPTGGAAASLSPSFHAKLGSWHKPFLPPKFRIFTGAFSRKWTKLPENAKETLIATASYGGWSGLKTLDCKIKYMDAGGSTTKIQTIKRIGWGREYHVVSEGAIDTDVDGRPIQSVRISAKDLVWKGTKTAIHHARGQGDLPTTRSVSNGNLKMLLPGQSRVLAVWENRTNWPAAGSLLLYEDFEEGASLEKVLFSCVAVVAGGRMSGRGWFGGILKQ